MSPELRDIQEQVDHTLERVRKLEDRFDQETGQPPWRYLVARPHAWRRQLCVKGRNMTVGQLMSTILANQLNPDAAAEDLDLPVEAIREAVKYYEASRDLIQLEALEERRRLAEQGYRLEPPTTDS